MSNLNIINQLSYNEDINRSYALNREFGELVAPENMTINDKRQQTALGGRIGNAKSDKIRGDINKETLEHKNKRKLFGYVSNPGKGKDYAITPLNENRVNRKTDITEGNNYRIDTIFIDTLNDNPLVNDLMHQKNIDFNTGK
jgi:hypothetical protein